MQNLLFFRHNVMDLIFFLFGLLLDPDRKCLNISRQRNSFFRLVIDTVYRF